MPPSNLSVPDDFLLNSNGLDMLALRGTSATPVSVIHAPSAMPDDGDLGNNTIAPSIDEVDGALNIRVKYSDGTLETGVLRFVKSTLTVAPSGGDFTSIQAAWNYLKGRVLNSAVTIDVAAGTYNEAVVLRDQPYGALISIRGDARTAAGQHFATTGSITKAGSNCTITLVNTPPSDFTNADHIVIGGTASGANVGRFPIVSINTGAKTVTYQNAAGVAEAVLTHTRLVFCPNRIINFTGNTVGVDSGRGGATSMSGFTMLSSAASGAFAVRATAGGSLGLQRMVAYGILDTGFYAANGGQLGTDANSAAVACRRGFEAAANGLVFANGTYSANHADASYLASIGGFLSAPNAIATKGQYGFLAQLGATMSANGAACSQFGACGFKAEYTARIHAEFASATFCVNGYVAEYVGCILALSTSANNASNGTNYVPATTGTLGTTGGVMQWT